MHRIAYKLLLTLAAVVLAIPAAQAERVKDIASVAGVRTNQLIGYGLVVGLDGTGDQTSQAPFTIQSIRSMLAKFGVTIPSNVNPQLKNVAAVVVTADLPPFTKTGQTDEAIRHYKRALELDNSLGGAHYGVAFLLLKRGETAQAADHLRAFLSRPPKGADADRWVRHAETALRDIANTPAPEAP